MRQCSKAVTVTLFTDAIRLDEKRTVKLRPLVEKITGTLARIPEDMSSLMGIPFKADKTEIKIFDDEGYKKAVAKKAVWDKLPPLIETASFWPVDNDVLLNTERWCRKFADMEGYSDDELTVFGILIGSWHEISHLSHYCYNDELFEKSYRFNQERNRWYEFMGKRPTWSKWFMAQAGHIYSYRNVLGGIRNLAVAEGVACYTEENMIRKYIEPNYRYPLDKDEILLPFVKKLKKLYDDPHNLGFWFVKRVSDIIKANPVKLVIDNPPKTYLELFTPEIYVIRMGIKGSLV